MFDSHAHYDDKRFDPDRDALLSGLLANGVEYIINVGCDLETSMKSVALTKSYDRIYAAAGCHPHYAADLPRDYLEKLEELLGNKKVVAIGEIGLDFHYDLSPRDIQRRVFSEQMRLAEKYGLPVVIHDREAHKECLDTVLSFPSVTGVFHSFSGSAESAEILYRAGWYISVNGIITFKNAAVLPEAVKKARGDRLLIETDAPYLSPHPFRGQRNDSGHMRYTLERIAELRGVSFADMEKTTTENARRLFGI